ncbi:MAG: hypothetical protein PHG08_00760 [Bacilli bacterium]|nr:hypothetical protein [Bacilli bacterium]
MKKFKDFVNEDIFESMTTEVISTGEHKVLWKGEPTIYHINNGSAGMGGRGTNVYGIHNKETGKYTPVGSLQKAKKTVNMWLTAHEKKKMQEDAPANAVGTNPPDKASVAGEPFKKSGILPTIRRKKKPSEATIAKNQARERDDSDFQ